MWLIFVSVFVFTFSSLYGDDQIYYTIKTDLSINSNVIEISFNSPTCLDGLLLSDHHSEQSVRSVKLKCDDDYKWEKLLLKINDNQYATFSLPQSAVVTDLIIQQPKENENQKITPIFCTENRQSYCGKKRTILNQEILNQKLFSSDSRGKRAVSGTMTTNSVLTVSESPYDVVADVMVPDGKVLIIESGVQLHFALNSGLTVKGRLIAQGGNQNNVIMILGTTNVTRWKGVFFRTTYKQFDLNLAEGRYANEGIVQIFDTDKWYSVCIEEWNNTTATVACKQLGYSRGSISSTNIQSSANASSPFWRNVFRCSGNETRLSECGTTSVSGACQSSAPVMLQCLGASPQSTSSTSETSILEYVNITNSVEGIVVDGMVPLMNYVTVMNSISNGITIDTRYFSSVGNPKLYKCLFVNNKGHGIQLNFSFPTEDKAIAFEIEDCLTTAGGESGLYVVGRGHLSIRNTAFFGNAKSGIESRLSSGSIDITGGISASNGRYALLFQRDSGYSNEKMKITVRNCNFTGHWFSSAVSFDARSNCDITFDNCFFWENYNGAISVTSINNSDIRLMNSNFTRNRGDVLNFADLGQQNKLIIDNNRFTLNLISNNTPYQSIIGLKYQEGAPLLSVVEIAGNDFYKNTMHRVITIEPVLSFGSFGDKARNIETTLFRNNLKDNLVLETVLLDVSKANISLNNFYNPVSECELKMGPYHQGSRIVASYNFWGASQNAAVAKRICDYNRNNNLMQTEYQPFMETEVIDVAAIKESKVANQEELGGTLKKESFVLSARNKPYVIIDTLQVGIGSSLTIEPGVVIEFELDRGAYILGQMNAIGTADKPIIFRSSKGQIWSGLVFENAGSPVSNLEYCIIDGSQHGIVLKSDRVVMRSCMISHPLLTGITITDGASGFINFGGTKIAYAQDIGLRVTNRKNSIEIHDLIIENTGGNGIDFDNPVMNISLNNVKLSNSRRYAIHIDQTMSSHQFVEIRNSLIANQRGVGGVYITGRNYQMVTVADSSFVNNTASSLIVRLRCNYSGDYLRIAPPFNLVNNTFEYNSDLVVDIDLMYCTNANISANQFVRNNLDRRTGVFRLEMEPVEDYGKENFRVIFSANTFDQNTGEFTAYLLAMNIDEFVGYVTENRFINNENRRSVLILGSPLFSVNNNIFNNKRSTYYIEAEYNDNRVLNATRNYWGTNNDQEILSTIFDGTKIGTRGTVNFRPFLTSANGTSTGTTANCVAVNNCSNHGECVTDNICRCYPGYMRQDCSEITCRDQLDCSNNGRCVGPNVCSCFSGWYGTDCRTPTCIAVNNCTGHGQCISLNECECFLGYIGSDCNQASQSNTTCIGNCNGRGTCIGANQCRCNSGWSGRNCELADCSNVNFCSSRGVCVGPNQCNCFTGYSGTNCSTCEGGSCQISQCNTTCIHGVCDPSTRSCICNSGWSGETCSICSNGANPNESCVLSAPEIKYILPESVSTDPDSKIFIYGNNLGRNFFCRFGNLTVAATVHSANLLHCNVSKMPAGKFSFEIMDDKGVSLRKPENGNLSMTVYQSCATLSCNSQQSVCFDGACICSSGYSGNTCDTKAEQIPIDFDQLQTAVTENEPLSIKFHLKTNISGARWTLTQGPPNMTINPNTGELRWEKPTGSTKPIKIEVSALTTNGVSSATMEKKVDPTYYPTIDDSFVTQQNTVQLNGTVHPLPNVANTNFANRAVKILIFKNGNLYQSLETQTNNKNQFSANFVPDYGTGGNYIAIALHPGNDSISSIPESRIISGANWTIQSLIATPETTTLQYDRSISSGRVKIILQNFGAMSLRSFNVKLKPGLAVSATIETSLEFNGANVSSSFELQPNNNLTVVVNVQNLKEYEGPLIFFITTAEGLTSECVVNVVPTVDGPFLVVQPSSLKIASSLTESNANYKIILTNKGRKPVSQIQLKFQNETPLFLISAWKENTLFNSLDNLQIASNESVTLLLGVLPRNVPLVGDMNGSLNITTAEGLVFTVKYEMRMKSNLTFDAILNFTGENVGSNSGTTVVDQNPRMDGVRVTLSEVDVGFKQSATSNVNGQVLFSNMLDGYYLMECFKSGYDNLTKYLYLSSTDNVYQFVMYKKTSPSRLVLNRNEHLEYNLEFVKPESDNDVNIPLLNPLEIDVDFDNLSTQTKPVTFKSLGGLSIDVLPPTGPGSPPIIETTLIGLPNNSVVKTTVKVNMNSVNKSDQCLAYLIHPVYNYTAGGVEYQRKFDVVLRKAKYKTNDISVCEIGQNGTLKKVTLARKELIACDCRAVLQAQCNSNYESLKMCGSGSISQNAGLQTVVQIFQLLYNCRSTLTNLEQSANAVGCTLGIPDICLYERNAFKRLVKRQAGHRKYLETTTLNSVINPLKPIFPLLRELNAQPAAIMQQFQNLFTLIKQILPFQRLDIPLDPWFRVFLQSISYNSPSGEIISSNEFDKIILSINEPLTTMGRMAKEQGFDVRADEYTVSNFLRVWNETVKSWSNGLLSSKTAEIIPYDKLITFVNLSNYLSKISAENGYSSMFELLDNQMFKINSILNITPETFCLESTVFVSVNEVEENKDFSVELSLKNLQNYPLNNINIQLTFVPESNYSQIVNFYPGLPSLNGIASIDGNSNLATGGTFGATWLVQASVSERLHRIYRYKCSIQISFRYSGGRGVTNVYSTPFSVQPKPSLKVFYFIQPSVPKIWDPAEKNPYNVIIAIMNNGYIDLENIQLKSVKIRMVDPNDRVKSVPFKLQNLLIDNKSYGTDVEPKLSSVKSGEVKVIRYSFISPENATLTNFDARIFVNGEIIRDIESEHFSIEKFFTSLTPDTTGPIPNMLVSSGINGETNFVYNSKTTRLHPVDSSQLIAASNGTIIINGKQYRTTRVQFRKQTRPGVSSATGMYGHFELQYILNDTFQLLYANTSNYSMSDNSFWIVNQVDRLPSVNFVDALPPADQVLMTYDFVFGEPNKNWPEFVQLQQSVSAPPDSPTGYSVTKVEAKDSDGENVTYQIYGGDGNFVINQNTGEIKLKNQFPSGASKYCLTVAATDNGLPPKHTVAPILVQVTGTEPSNEQCTVTDDLEQLISQNQVVTRQNVSSNVESQQSTITPSQAVSFGVTTTPSTSASSSVLSTSSTAASNGTLSTQAIITLPNFISSSTMVTSSSTLPSTVTSISTTVATTSASTTITNGSTSSSSTSIALTSSEAATTITTSGAASTTTSATSTTSTSTAPTSSEATSVTASTTTTTTESSSTSPSTSATLTIGTLELTSPVTFQPISSTNINLFTAFVTGSNQISVENSSFSTESAVDRQSTESLVSQQQTTSVPLNVVASSSSSSNIIENTILAENSSTSSSETVSPSSQLNIEQTSPEATQTTVTHATFTSALPFDTSATNVIPSNTEISGNTNNINQPGSTSSSESVVSFTVPFVSATTGPVLSHNEDRTNSPNRNKIGDLVTLPTDIPDIDSLKDDELVMLACKLKDQKPIWKVICDLGKGTVKNSQYRKQLYKT